MWAERHERKVLDERLRVSDENIMDQAMTRSLPVNGQHTETPTRKLASSEDSDDEDDKKVADHVR